MSNDKEQPIKSKMMTEDEYKKRLTEEITRQRNELFTYTIDHKLNHYGTSVAPEIVITLRGGNIEQVRNLGNVIAQTVINFAKEDTSCVTQ